jgi:hypothetical protein
MRERGNAVLKNERVNPEYSEKGLPQYYFSHDKSHKDCIRIEPRPSL